MSQKKEEKQSLLTEESKPANSQKKNSVIPKLDDKINNVVKSQKEPEVNNISNITKFEIPEKCLNSS